MNSRDRNGVQIDAFQAPHVDRPEVGRCSRTTERKDAAGRAEVVRGLVGVKLIGRELTKRGEYGQIVLANPVG